MTTSQFSRGWRLVGWGLGLLLLLPFLGAGPSVRADPITPPPLSASAPVGRTTPASAPEAVLYSQLDNQSTNGVRAQNFKSSTYAIYDSAAAADFTIPTGGGINAWEIYTVEVPGLYYLPSPATVASATVQFYANNAGTPGAAVYTAEPATVGDTSAGYLVLRLTTPAVLGAGNTYWVSVQANKAFNTGYWYWRERTNMTNAEAYWRNPRNGYLRGCVGWSLIRLCDQGGNYPEVGFALAGNASTSNATPVLSLLSPNAMANQAFRLQLTGANFAPGTTVQWTDGSTTELGSATYVDGNHVEIDVPQNLTTNINANVTVKVTVPGPCVASCESNALTFRITNRLYLPRVSK